MSASCRGARRQRSQDHRRNRREHRLYFRGRAAPDRWQTLPAYFKPGHRRHVEAHSMNPSKYLLTSSREYAIYVCRNRAIPYVGDGLKHGQMIALWLLRHRADKLRTFALSGLMAFERLYVHGEVSANDA